MRYSDEPDCLLLSDAFNEYFYPETGMDALKVLQAIGYTSKNIIDHWSRQNIDFKGISDQAKKHAEHLVDEIKRIDPDWKATCHWVRTFGNIYTKG